MSFFDTIEKLQPSGRSAGRRRPPAIRAARKFSQSSSRRPRPRKRRRGGRRSCPFSLLARSAGDGFSFLRQRQPLALFCLPAWSNRPARGSRPGPDRPEPDPDRQVDAEFSTTSTPMSDSLSPVHQGHPGSAGAKEILTAAWPWIKSTCRTLAAGSTRAGLVGRGKLRHPVGAWGVAWLSVWREQLLDRGDQQPGSNCLFLSHTWPDDHQNGT